MSRQCRAAVGAHRPVTATDPLSQSIVAGIAGIADFSLATLSGLAVYFIYVAPVVEGKLELYCTAIGLFALLLVQSLYAAGMYRFSVLMSPARHAGRQLAVYAVLFLLFIAFGFALKISTRVLQSMGIRLVRRSPFRWGSGRASRWRNSCERAR